MKEVERGDRKCETKDGLNKRPQEKRKLLIK